MTASDEAILAAAARVKAAGQGSPRHARDPVNMAAIRTWTDAMGDVNPLYTDAEFAARSALGGLVAPPAMIQVWTMPGLRPAEAGHASAAENDADPLGQMMTVLDEAGFTAVVATNCDQTYHRYLHHGELLSLRSELTDVTGPKRTALGEGWFVTTRNVWYADSEPVAEMDWRVLKFRPTVPTPADDSVLAATAGSPARADGIGGSGGALPPEASTVMRPTFSPDTEFFWTGTRVGELRVQRCAQCGVLRHPPGPACLGCGSLDKPDYQVAAGTGFVYSFVVHHHPPVPGRKPPFVVGLIELTEGVRMLGELTGIEPGKVEIGMPVLVGFDRVDDELTMPVWRPAAHVPLPELSIEVTPTVVISTALATRDFYPAHHDRDFAVATGSSDIFLNILTTTGLVQRYVTDWAGPQATVRAISIRLGVPCYAGDTLTFTGQVTGTDNGEKVVAVTGRCALGDHVTGTVRLAGGTA